ncbi:MAG: serine hydrolase [Oscillospiraceae bacterium]|jgi:CubicO group peptidase (beta-lactamase class C family)|nr:serine hydrolase [Oscillospiraceae bacterium]
MTIEKRSLKRAEAPQAAGVSSAVIGNFIQDLCESGIETHSLMVLRHGEIAFESWSAPYAPEVPHMMYSVSKSFASAAIGLAIEEGFLRLDTRLIDIFPEYAPQKRDENLEKLTVYHLLTMTAGKNVNFLSGKANTNWAQDFFGAPWKFAPGESWQYVNENIYMLCAALTKLTGMSVTDFLAPRLYEPLGFGRVPFWETDPSGIEAGGWGLFLTTEELAKFALCYLQGGQYEGKQILPAEWAQASVRKHADSISKNIDGVFGYGMCFWRNSCPNTFRADGMFSQFAIVFEDYDAILVITASEVVEQHVRDCIWRHFPRAFTDKNEAQPLPVPQALPRLAPLEDLPPSLRSPLEKNIAGRTIRMRKQRLLKRINMPLSMLPVAVVYMSSDKAGNIDNIKFEFGDQECTMLWAEGDEQNSIVCGMDGTPRVSPLRLAGMDFTASATAAWQSDNRLSVWVRPREAVCQRRVDFTFHGGRVKAAFGSAPETKTILHYIALNVDDFIKNPLLVKLVQGVLHRAHKFIEPSHKGRFAK